MDLNGVHFKTYASYPQYIEDWILNNPEVYETLFKEKVLKIHDHNLREVEMALEEKEEKSEGSLIGVVLNGKY